MVSVVYVVYLCVSCILCISRRLSVSRTGCIRCVCCSSCMVRVLCMAYNVYMVYIGPLRVCVFRLFGVFVYVSFSCLWSSRCRFCIWHKPWATILVYIVGLFVFAVLFGVCL